MIPAEAVEAAAKKLYQASGLTVWDKEDESTRNFYRRNAKSALEAAAPYMLAAAWEEGWDTFAGFDSRPGGPYPANPHRPTDAV